MATWDRPNCVSSQIDKRQPPISGKMSSKRLCLCVCVCVCVCMEVSVTGRLPYDDASRELVIPVVIQVADIK